MPGAAMPGGTWKGAGVVWWNIDIYLSCLEVYSIGGSIPVGRIPKTRGRFDKPVCIYPAVAVL